MTAVGDEWEGGMFEPGRVATVRLYLGLCFIFCRPGGHSTVRNGKMRWQGLALILLLATAATLGR